MNELFEEDVKYASSFVKLSEEELKVLEEADSAAEEFVMPEYEHYMNHEFDTEAVPIAKKTRAFRNSSTCRIRGPRAKTNNTLARADEARSARAWFCYAL